MNGRFEKIASDAMKLPPRDRVRLAQRLVASLDDEIEPGVEALWIAEAERRFEELLSGKVTGIGAAEAFKNAREALNR